jgi:nucleotide-binding universal stress UspA family protein
MTDSQHDRPPHRGAVVVGFDGSPGSERALDWASDHAFREGRRLTVVRPHAEALLDLSRTAQLVVVGAHGHGSTWLAERAECPVVVVPDVDHEIVRQGVLVGVPSTSDAGGVLDFACQHASRHDLPLSVVHAAKAIPGQDHDRHRWLADALGGRGELFPGLRIHVVLLPGRPSGILLRMAERTSLLVVGRQRATRLRRSPFGHMRSSSIVDRSPCPVAVVSVR